MVELASTIWADGPSVDPHEPDKHQIRVWGTWVEGIITAFTSSGGLIYSSLALLNADLTRPANSMAWVIGDPIAGNNGVYGKVGASGVGSWTRRSDLPFSFIIASNVGAGTPNAIQATTSISVSGSALIWMNVTATNTGSPVTVSFNGGSALTIKTNAGNDPVAGGLVAGMIVLGIVSGSTFRLVSDQASSAIVTAAEGWANIAQAAANNNLVFVTKAAASASTISGAIHSIEVKGSVTEIDGLGGLFVDTNNGSTETFTSNGGTRTWYLAPDVSTKRLGAASVTVPKLASDVVSLIDTKIAAVTDKKTTATIKHVRDGTYIYDVITVKNHSAKLVRQEFAPGVAADGVVTRVTCQQYAKATGAQVVINAAGFRAPDGSSYETSPQARPMGLSIANGILYQDWLGPETRTQAIVMMGNGQLVEANKGDGVSGAQWVANGAQWAVCFGVICVRSGSAVNVDASYIGTAISARTVIGQKANGDIVIITIEGSTGVYGASGTQCGTIAQALGCVIAYVCDGGGSTQAWWKDCYAMPTSDATERALPNFIVVDADIIGDYDTGWVSLPLEAGLSAQVGSLPGLAFRQVNETVHLQVNVAAAATFTTTATVLHTNDFPLRFQPFIVGLARGFVSGPSGNAGSVFMGSKVSGKAQTGTLAYISGVVSWPAKYAGLPSQAAA